MFLHDIGKSPDTTFRRINHLLESNYGFKISENVSDDDLVLIMEQIDEEITDLKLKGDNAKASPEISKRLLILEGLRNLREFAMMSSLKSPKLEKVISDLTEFVVETFELSALHETSNEDFDNAVKQAMNEYRSSRYRFPDDYVERRVREGAMAALQASSCDDSSPEMSSPMLETDVEEDSVWDRLGDYKRTMPADLPDTPAARHALKQLDNPKLSVRDEIPMVVDKRGRKVPDPFAAQAAERRKGIVYPVKENKNSAKADERKEMKEQSNLVKNLRRLLETEVSQAEVMMAAKGFASELQEMIEKIGRLQNEDLPPVTDQMRETYGTQSASAFQTQIYGALQSVMDSLYSAKGQVDDAVTNMAATGQVDATIDMEKDFDSDAEGMDDMAAGMDAEVGDDLDNIGADLDAEATDDFGAEDGEEPLGRSKKMESTEQLQARVMEMRKLVEKARKLKEASK